MGIIAPPQQGSIPISAAVVTSAILQNAATTDGNGTDYDITGMATVQLLVKPVAYTGTVTFWASLDGTTFIKIKGNQQDTTTIADNVANPGSTASIWTFQTAGLTKIRAVMSSSGGTSCTVTGAASPFPNSVPLGVTLTSAVLAAGSAQIGHVILDAGASGGATPTHLLSAASNNATNVKGSAGTLYGYSLSNTTASTARYVKFYNKATTPAPGTDTTLLVRTVLVPGNSVVHAAFPVGINFSSGIGFAAVANAADNDNTSIAAGDLSIDLLYL